MNSDDLLHLRKRLTQLEIKFDERWNAHDRLADERGKTICRKLEQLRVEFKNTHNFFVEKFNSLPCGEQVIEFSKLKGKIDSNSLQLNKLWALVVTVIVLGIVLGIWARTL